jgi:GDPmannose 4,6-dehydratase
MASQDVLHYGDLGNTGNLVDVIYQVRRMRSIPGGAKPSRASSIANIPAISLVWARWCSGNPQKRHEGARTGFFQRDVWQRCRRRVRRHLSSRRSRAAAKVYSTATRTTAKVIDACCNGILFNRSPRRGETFVTRKITRALAAIKAEKQKALYLGNLDARRDWGYAPDYVAAMWKMLQHDAPGDFVIGTGEAHSVREFLDEAFGYLDMDWHEYVKIDPRYFRPTEVDYLLADPSKSRQTFGWEPRVFSRTCTNHSGC